MLLGVILNLCLLIISCHGQRNFGDNLNDRIQNVFGSGVRGGFGDIVTPEPEVVPTQFPQVITNNNGQSCKCVPYWQCEAKNPVRTTDNRINAFGEIDVRYDASPESCQDVLDVCCQTNGQQQTNVPVQTTPPTAAPPPQINQPTGCGIRKVGGIDFSLAGNQNFEAGFGEFPWTIALLTQNTECLCGGSLIHPSVVLTGSHCVFNLTSNNLKIRAGEWDTQTTKERLPFQEINVQQIITHPEFNTKTLANDIALLILQTPVRLDEHINVICLPSQGYFSNSRSCIASGWGKDVFGKEGKYSVILKKVPLPMVQPDACQESLRRTRLGRRFILHPSFVCAGGEENIDTCQGDGGSPLVCPIGVPSDNRYIQVGAVAWGIGCKDVIPAVYTNIAFFREWIDGHVNNYGFDPSTYSF